MAYKRDGSVWRSRWAYYWHWIKPGAFIKTDDDFEWLADGERYGWKLDPAAKAAWPLRVWGIRHVRWFALTCRVEAAAARWASVGIGIGGPNPRDVWVLYAILRGWA